MDPRIPKGGFFAAKYNHQNLADIEHRLELNCDQTFTSPGNGLLLGVWKEFHGQGIWSNNKAASAYDLDLTNIPELMKLAGFSQDEPPDFGELLWTLYKKFGLDFLGKLRGAFGLALFDEQDKKLIVATDPYGIRPIVYSQKFGKFIAASRIRHITFDQSISRDTNPEAIYHYLFFQAICTPVTIYRDIYKLEPGKGLSFTNNILNDFTYYDIQYHPDISKPVSYWLKTIPQEVEKAVKKFANLSPYEKTGCFLSGGTDSSSVAGYYTKLVGKPAKTFSIGFNVSKYNELEYARIAANNFGTEQTEYIVTPEDVRALLGLLCQIYDEPFGNASVIPAYHCARVAKEKGVDILLAGDGGDEIFGGNERYANNLIFEKYFILPNILRESVIEPVLANLPNYAVFHKAKQYIRRANITNPERFYSYNLLRELGEKSVFKNEFLSQIDLDCFINLAKSHFKKNASAHITDQLLYLDMKFTITDNDLRKVTQMAESAGVRVRYPFLDRNLVEFTATIPPTLKVKLGKNRYIFKRAMENLLPIEIIKKPKHGMGVPIADWFKSDPLLSELLYDNLFAGSPCITQFIRPSFLEEMKYSFETESSPYYGDNLWVFLVLELWLKKMGYNFF